MSRHWPVYPKRVDYNTFTEIKNIPVFRLKPYQSGFHWEEYNARTRTYGSLAGRTIGAMYGAKDTARFGLELSYDSILRGTNGIVHRRKVRNKFLDITDTPPIDGADIVTTIDVSIQDLAERSLIDELKEINANVGVAIVMDVPTGDIKAIVNMEKCFDGEYREIHNHAVSYFSGARFGVQASLYPRSAGRRSGRHDLSRRNRWRYMADVRQRNERPQLAKRRIRNADPRTDPVVQFEHRCEPHQ